MHAVLTSAGAVLANFVSKSCLATPRLGPDSKSATTALIRALLPGSTLARTSASLLANPSLSSPQSPPGSAIETAMPAAITLSRSSVHSCAVKLFLSAMDFSLLQTHNRANDYSVELRGGLLLLKRGLAQRALLTS